LPPSELWYIPRSVPAKRLLLQGLPPQVPLESVASTRTLRTGKSGIGLAPPKPSARTKVAPKLVVWYMCPTPVNELKPDKVRYATFELCGSTAMPVA
jgi:hypothetical protein